MMNYLKCIIKSCVCLLLLSVASSLAELECEPEPDQFRCASKTTCFQYYWYCDGLVDCNDKSDEINCEPSSSGSPCRGNQFQCTGDQTDPCIPKFYQCDNEHDCRDGSDEAGCSKPSISKPPPPEMQLTEGDTFTITCTAVGIPVPVIVWRRNGGHVPANCTSTSVKGVGTLTCHNIRSLDAGTYSCEGLSRKGIEVSKPNCTLLVKPKTEQINSTVAIDKAVDTNQGLLVKPKTGQINSTVATGRAADTKRGLGAEVILGLFFFWLFFKDEHTTRV